MKNKQNKQLAVCGIEAVKSLERSHPEAIRKLYFNEERAPHFGGLCKKLAKQKTPYNKVENEELEKLCGSVHHQGVVAMIDAPEIPRLSKEDTQNWIDNKESVILLDRVGNANNLGAIVRSAAFFGIQNIVIPLDEAQTSITTSSYRVAQGGMEFVNVYAISSISFLLKDLKGKMIRIGTDVRADITLNDLSKAAADMPVILVLGNEEHGISKEVKENCDYLMKIQGKSIGKDSEGKDIPQIESLNVAQAATLCMYEMTRL